MNDSMEKHWNRVYSSGETRKLGWYEQTPAACLKLLSKCDIGKDEPVLDVGAGASTFIDALISEGYKKIMAADISETALRSLRERLGEEKASAVQWIIDDITRPVHLQNLRDVALWHDRGLLHFLREEAPRKRYLSTLRKVVKRRGYVIIAVFSPEAPDQCSGLKLRNYDAEMLEDFLGADFKLLDHFNHTYTMPSGKTRPYIYTLFQKQ